MHTIATCRHRISCVILLTMDVELSIFFAKNNDLTHWGYMTKGMLCMAFLSPLRKRKKVEQEGEAQPLNHYVYDRGLRLMRDNRLKRLLDSRHSIIPEELEQLGITFPGRWFILVLVKVQEIDRTDASLDASYGTICSTIQSALTDSVMEPWVFMDEWDVYAIVNFDSEAPELQRLKILDLLEPALCMLRQETRLPLKAFVSKLEQHMQDISNQRRSLNALCDYETVLNRDTLVLTQERVIAASPDQCYRFDGLRTMEETDTFFSSILSENFSAAQGSLTELIRQMLLDVDLSTLAPNAARVRLDYLIQLMDIAVDATRLRMDSAVFSTMFPRLDFRECSNVQEFQKISAQVLQELQSSRAEVTPESGYAMSWVADVKSFVDLHFTELTLNVNFLAQEFDLNPSYMSRVFRDRVGIGLPEYIQGLRLRLAKQMLAAGHAVAETAEASGFGSTRSMTRAFQKSEQTTPGKFRTEHMATQAEKEEN